MISMKDISKDILVGATITLGTLGISGCAPSSTVTPIPEKTVPSTSIGSINGNDFYTVEVGGETFLAVDGPESVVVAPLSKAVGVFSAEKLITADRSNDYYRLNLGENSFLFVDGPECVALREIGPK